MTVFKATNVARITKNRECKKLSGSSNPFMKFMTFMTLPLSLAFWDGRPNVLAF
jgi:hypothetical protein